MSSAPNISQEDHLHQFASTVSHMHYNLSAARVELTQKGLTWGLDFETYELFSDKITAIINEINTLLRWASNATVIAYCPDETEKLALFKVAYKVQVKLEGFIDFVNEKSLVPDSYRTTFRLHECLGYAEKDIDDIVKVSLGKFPA